jgi:hypothetical protein
MNVGNNVFVYGSNTGFRESARSFCFREELSRLNGPRTTYLSQREEQRQRLLGCFGDKDKDKDKDKEVLEQLFDKKWVMLDRDDAQAKDYLTMLLSRACMLKTRTMKDDYNRCTERKKPVATQRQNELQRTCGIIDQALKNAGAPSDNTREDLICLLIKESTGPRSIMFISNLYNRVKSCALYDFYRIPLEKRDKIRLCRFGTVLSARDTEEWRHYYAMFKNSLKKHYPSEYYKLFATDEDPGDECRYWRDKLIWVLQQATN